MNSQIGILGDVHLDGAALTRTLEGPLRSCDRLISVGDVVDRGPDQPAEVLDVLQRRGVELMVGNHELAYLGGPMPSGMFEQSGADVAGRLRSLVLDGHMVAARVARDVLCVHGGISRRFWQQELRPACGADINAIATMLNRLLVLAVSRRSFAHPIFDALADPLPGPFWARVDDDLLADQLPPFRQAVGHVSMPVGQWMTCDRGEGSVFPLDRSSEADVSDRCIGHLILDVDAAP